MAIITDHEDAAVRRLLEQYKDKPLIEGLIRCLVADVQEEEQAGCDLNDFRLDIENTSGTNLDRLGEIVGAERRGLNDADYRIRIQVKIVQNVSEGEPERLIQVLGLLTEDKLVHLQELTLASVGMGAVDGTIDPGDVDFIHEQLELVAAAGIRVDFLTCFDETEPFAFAGLLPGAGFSSLAAPGVGGKLGFLHRQTLPEFAFDGSEPDPGGFGTLADPYVGGFLQGL